MNNVEFKDIITKCTELKIHDTIIHALRSYDPVYQVYYLCWRNKDMYDNNFKTKIFAVNATMLSYAALMQHMQTNDNFIANRKNISVRSVYRYYFLKEPVESNDKKYERDVHVFRRYNIQCIELTQILYSDNMFPLNTYIS